MPLATVICDRGHTKDISFRASVGATEAARACLCDTCGSPVTVDWQNMGMGRPRMAFRDGTYDIGGDKVRCETKKHYEREAHRRGLFVRSWS